MSGVRRKTKYRKAVQSDILDSLPEPKENEEVVRISELRGGNLVEVETMNGSKSLCRLPQRYRNVVFVKRGTMLIVATCSEDYQTASGEPGKVKFIANHILFSDEQIKNLKNKGLLPQIFQETSQEKLAQHGINQLESEEEDGEDDKHVNIVGQGNPNRRFNVVSSSSEEEDENDE